MLLFVVGGLYMKENPENQISVNSTISLKGLVKAIFNDTVHVQIGGKVITLPIADLQFGQKGTRLEKNI